MRQNKLLFLIVFALAIIAGGMMLQKVSAQGITLNDLLFPHSQSNTPKITTEISNPLLNQLDTPKGENISSSSTLVESPDNQITIDTVSPTLVESPDNQIAINTASDLIKKADTKFLIPGWLHITSTRERFPSVTKTLPNGNPIPSKFINDAWYLLGENGYVSKAVIVDDTGDAFTTQVVVFEDGLWKNLTIPETNLTTKETYQIKTLDQGILGSSSSLNKTYKLEKVKSSTGDGSLTLVTKTDIFDAPVIVDQTLPVSGMISKYTLSDTSGRILSLETYQIYPDGSIVLWDRITTTVVENVDAAPAEMLKYFKR